MLLVRAFFISTTYFFLNANHLSIHIHLWYEYSILPNWNSGWPRLERYSLSWRSRFWPHNRSRTSFYRRCWTHCLTGSQLSNEPHVEQATVGSFLKIRSFVCLPIPQSSSAAHIPWSLHHDGIASFYKSHVVLSKRRMGKRWEYPDVDRLLQKVNWWVWAIRFLLEYIQRTQCIRKLRLGDWGIPTIQDQSGHSGKSCKEYG